ncbi:hypothetical protein E0500_002580 [Streptomyces sp. KM273126]|uniref:hypothetical protein n=1 Tax=Streptomyces sp. KM273126 TaxID=2545247 RepID=UPI0010408FA7|nr:hypothetical protein [Streptomyces sp. KM273126]MBA2806371.1 hypothetical protein [Streptomyces sp. KM273126]
MYSMTAREQSGDTKRAPAHLSRAVRSRTQGSVLPPHLARVLEMQGLAGNAATTETLTVQRMSRRRDSSDSDLAYGSSAGSSSSGPRRHEDDGSDSDLAYGSDSGSPSRRADNSFSGSVGGVRFVSQSNNGRMMRQIFNVVESASSHFSQELSAAGAITVQLGRTQGGTPGEWRPDSRTVVLDPRRATPSHLGGTAVFEILNAAAEGSRAALDADVLNGRLDSEAERAGWPPDQFYAREMERIEWRNGIRHREIMIAAGLSRSSANLFSAEGDFESYYERQVRSGHTHSYEFRYHLLREQAASEAARREER